MDSLNLIGIQIRIWQIEYGLSVQAELSTKNCNYNAVLRKLKSC